MVLDPILVKVVKQHQIEHPDDYAMHVALWENLRQAGIVVPGFTTKEKCASYPFAMVVLTTPVTQKHRDKLDTNLLGVDMSVGRIGCCSGGLRLSGVNGAVAVFNATEVCTVNYRKYYHTYTSLNKDETASVCKSCNDFKCTTNGVPTCHADPEQSDDSTFRIAVLLTMHEEDFTFEKDPKKRPKGYKEWLDRPSPNADLLTRYDLSVFFNATTATQSATDPFLFSFFFVRFQTNRYRKEPNELRQYFKNVEILARKEESRRKEQLKGKVLDVDEEMKHGKAIATTLAKMKKVNELLKLDVARNQKRSLEQTTVAALASTVLADIRKKEHEINTHSNSRLCAICDQPCQRLVNGQWFAEPSHQHVRNKWTKRFHYPKCQVGGRRWNVPNDGQIKIAAKKHRKKLDHLSRQLNKLQAKFELLDRRVSKSSCSCVIS